ncbi:hypothetical protein [Flavivirga algicola]|uniref:Lipoprotein n=1 Tax=Flavivirga algicola TaxID=2729136 RepID=A0ABX1RZ64_9FLAO|nr:hypothetical protein [Flavivirga algicola]NMH88862.1 hypothetical protein [Flavivirga algicola]
MKHKWIYLLLLSFFISCRPPEFEGNIRLLVKGNLVDENNDPIPDTKISIYTRKPDGLFSGDGNTFLLGTGYSKQNGAFSIIALYDQDDDFAIEVDGQNKFSTYIYATNTKSFFPEDLTFNLKTLELRTVSKVNYNITKTSPSATEFRFSFKFNNTNCYEFFDKGTQDANKTDCFEKISINRFLNDATPNTDNSFSTLLGTTVEFKYVIDDEPEVIETFIIDRENYDFNFSY